MDSEDKAQVEFEIEMSKPECTCMCHKPGNLMMHCVPCCGPGTHLRAPNFYDPEATIRRIQALLGDAYIEIEEHKKRVRYLENQVADGWTHPDEMAAKLNERDNKIAALRKSLAWTLSVVLDNTLEYIEDDPTGTRREFLRPELERLAELLRAK